MTFELVETTLKSLLLSTVKITSKKRTLGAGQIQLFDIKDPAAVLFEINMCRKSKPGYYVK